MAFDARALCVALPGACPELAAYHDQVVANYLSKLDRNDIEARVRALLFEHLPLGPVTKRDIAKKLNISPRTLQAKLSNRDMTFLELVNATRLALARGYMANSTLSITEIAYMLGFSDTSNFSRAFRRWTGESPREYLANRGPPSGDGPTPELRGPQASGLTAQHARSFDGA